MSKSQETYCIGLSVHRQDRGKHHWVISHNGAKVISRGDEGTHKKAKEVGIAALTEFCHKEDPAHY